MAHSAAIHPGCSPTLPHTASLVSSRALTESLLFAFAKSLRSLSSALLIAFLCILVFAVYARVVHLEAGAKCSLGVALFSSLAASFGNSSLSAFQGRQEKH